MCGRLFHSCAFDFSVWEIWGALLYGGRVVVVPFLVSRSPEAFYELLAKERVTVLNQTPSAFRQLIQAEEAVGQKDLALRYVIFGGEALEMQSLRPWFERHGDQTASAGEHVRDHGNDRPRHLSPALEGRRSFGQRDRRPDSGPADLHSRSAAASRCRSACRARCT